MRGKKEEGHKDKLVLSFINEQDHLTTLEVKFYQHQEEEFEVMVTRREGN